MLYNTLLNQTLRFCHIKTAMREYLLFASTPHGCCHRLWRSSCGSNKGRRKRLLPLLPHVLLQAGTSQGRLSCLSSFRYSFFRRSCCISGTDRKLLAEHLPQVQVYLLPIPQSGRGGVRMPVSLSPRSPVTVCRLLQQLSG